MLFDQLCESLNDFKEERRYFDDYYEIMQQLFKTMDKKQIKFYKSEFNKVNEARKIGKKYYPNTICYIISMMVVIHLQYRAGSNSIIPGPLSLPPEVAEVWIKKEFGSPTFQCPGCNFNWLPCLENTYKSFFKICPICGEKIEYSRS